MTEHRTKTQYLTDRMDDKNVVIERTRGKLKLWLMCFSWEEKLLSYKEADKIHHLGKSVNGEPKRVLKSTGEAGTFMLLILLLTFPLY